MGFSSIDSDSATLGVTFDMPLSTGIVGGEVLPTPISGTFLVVLVIVTFVVAVLAMPRALD